MEENTKDLQSSIIELEKSISFLTEQVRKQNSYKRNVSVSLVRGFSTAVGATVIFGVALAILVQAIKSIDYVPIVNSLMSSESVETIISNFMQQ